MIAKTRAVLAHARPFHWREALLCAPAMPLLILAGQLAGRPVEGATAAGAAFAVGFGSARELRGQRWGAMIAAMLGMAVAAFVGCVSGQNFALFVALAAAAAAICAASALRNEDRWWVVLQVVIALFVAGYYPGPVPSAVERGAAVLVGGGVQIALVVLLAQVFPRAARPSIRGATADPERWLLISHVGRAALCVALSMVAARVLGLASGYWAPMTALLVLKPRMHETRARGLSRLAGTLAGCAFATLYAHLCRDYAALLVLGMTLAAVAAFALQKAHYAGLTCAITATIVLLLTLGHSPALINAEHRIAATLLGGGIALLVALIIPHATAPDQVVPDRVGPAANA